MIIRKNNLTIRLAANFNRAIVDTPSRGEDPDFPHREYAGMEAAVQVMNGRIYAPLGFIAKALGAEVEWNSQFKQATATLEGIQVRIRPVQPAVSVPDNQQLSSARMKLLSSKLDEIHNSDAAYVGKRFKPYFTDMFLRTLMLQKGLHGEGRYGEPATLPEYTGKTSARFSQSAVLGNGLTGEDQYIEDRTVTLVWKEGAWKVDHVDIGLRILMAGFAVREPSEKE